MGWDPGRPDGRRGEQGRPGGGANRQGWGRGGPAASLRRSWPRGGWPRTRTEPRERGRREEGGSQPAAMGPGARARHRRLMSPLPPLPSVRALPLLLLLAGPGAAGEGPESRGLDRLGEGDGEWVAAECKDLESAAGGRPGSQGPKQGQGRRSPGLRRPSPGGQTQNEAGQGPRCPRHRGPGTIRAGDEGTQESGSESSRCWHQGLKIEGYQ